VIGTVAGVVSGLAVSGLLIAHTNVGEGGAIAEVIGITTGMATLGYYAGKQGDQRVRHIKILQ
jgi:hypothetical protein